MTNLTHKKFSHETTKKIQWVTKMYREWRLVRNLNPNVRNIVCNMDDMSSLTITNIVEGICRFLTEIKKLDGSDFPGKTLYDLVICLQFHLETKGFS